jgi:hypothetical protein
MDVSRTATNRADGNIAHLDAHGFFKIGTQLQSTDSEMSMAYGLEACVQFFLLRLPERLLQPPR